MASSFTPASLQEAETRSSSLEESLLSLEKLDRTSPELWPERKYANMSQNQLLTEIKKLHDTAYNLGLQEAKEMTRGRYLNIFNSKSKRGYPL